MKRVLCIVGGMNAGGAETFLMKIYRTIDKEYFQMDVATVVPGVYDEEIQTMGGRVYRITPKTQGPIKNFLDIKNLVKKENYKSVLRVSQSSLSALELLAAKCGGAEITAFRSSNSNTTSGDILNGVIHRLFMWMPIAFANVRIAPSTEAAEFMYGKKCIKNGKAVLLNNGLDLDVFRYDEDLRKVIRSELGVEDNIKLLGHVGRFIKQKNHRFLIEVFSEVHKKDTNTMLVLVGQGELEDEIKNRVEELGLTDSVIFTGVRKDVPALLSAMDVFVFPSFYEGMPNTVIEAQATGLPCLISDKITKEVKITDLVKYLDLEKGDEWVEKILSINLEVRKGYEQTFVEKGYDIQSQVENFTKLLFME